MAVSNSCRCRAAAFAVIGIVVDVDEEKIHEEEAVGGRGAGVIWPALVLERGRLMPARGGCLFEWEGAFVVVVIVIVVEFLSSGLSPKKQGGVEGRRE